MNKILLDIQEFFTKKTVDQKEFIINFISDDALVGIKTPVFSKSGIEYKENFKDRYQKIVASKQFKTTYENKNIGDSIFIDD